jgi:hypothetical protein
MRSAFGTGGSKSGALSGYRAHAPVLARTAEIEIGADQRRAAQRLKDAALLAEDLS